MPAYREVYIRAPVGEGWEGAWETDYGEPLGRGRAILQWARRELGMTRDAATAFLRRLYEWEALAGGWYAILDRAAIPAVRLLDYDRERDRLAVVVSALWCEACGQEPIASPRRLCVWCLAAPVGRAA